MEGTTIWRQAHLPALLARGSPKPRRRGTDDSLLLLPGELVTIGACRSISCTHTERGGLRLVAAVYCHPGVVCRPAAVSSCPAELAAMSGDHRSSSCQC